MMKNFYRIFLMTVSAVALLSCVDTPSVDFGTESNGLSVFGPDGGTATIKINSDDPWVVDVQDPWITVSPANGRGSAECQIRVDSTLLNDSRSASIYIDNLVTEETTVLQIDQEGYDKFIKVKKPEVEIESFEDYDKRYFDVEIEANVPVRLDIAPEDTTWLKLKNRADTLPKLNLDRGARPRKTKVRFVWGINSTENERNSTVVLSPSVPNEVVEDRNRDNIRLKQAAPEKIVEGVPGDSLALIAINRALGCWSQYEVNERMAYWEGVEVWKATDAGSEGKVGRVRSATFFLFGTKESLPFQVRYLTAAEELHFMSNTNTFLLNLEPGKDISKLKQLKRLTISAYGLTDLPEYFGDLDSLEYLDISGNNFQNIPEVLNKDEFPNLKALIMHGCQRYTITNLSITKKEKFGGFTEAYDLDEDGDKSFPKRLLEWDNLDTLRLSVNYFEGTLPDLVAEVESGEWEEKWTEEEVQACDTLPDILIGMPKVLPHTKFFAINHNRLHGELPDWLQYHPNLDYWMPKSLIYPQEGVTTYGTSAGFGNEWPNMDEYYKHYKNKKLAPKNTSKNE